MDRQVAFTQAAAKRNVVEALVRTGAVFGVLLATSLAGSPTAEGHPGRWFWSHAKLIRLIDQRPVRVRGRTIRVDGHTIACGGVGRRIVRHRVARWKHFNCVQPTFRPGVLIGPDLVFRVHVVGRRRILVTNARLTSY
jgi:hypothetical protein